ncbi:MAG: mitochondrial inner membrane protease ATP23, partial [Defluviitaleaceae bacterium]|nr:mitochondrial inner membrane protease ATP23 [Defluviitaleaceae bacterium]
GGDLSKSEGVDLNDNAGGAYDIANTKATEEIGKDLNEGNNEQLDALLDNFKEDKWGDLSLDEQKQSITDLADFVAADTGNENPPEIVFRDDMEDGTYGGYSPDSNIIEINVNMLYDSYEAADTISHEMWHAYQEQAAKDPNNPRAAEYQEGFDNYITPDLDFEGYENQMVEVEARAYAQGFKDRLNVLKGAA